MSVFRVKLQNSRQGRLDIYDNQRTAYIMGPNKVNRILKDGQTFVDSNYWKRFAYPQVSLEEAFIEVVEDDGTIYSDTVQENVYPRVYNFNVLPGSTFGDNVADIASDTRSYALFAQITNHGADEVKVRVNGLDSAVLDLPGGATQSFEVGDLTIGKLEVSNPDGESASKVQIVLSIRATSTS